jgi:hypothetical protein
VAGPTPPPSKPAREEKSDRKRRTKAPAPTAVVPPAPPAPAAKPTPPAAHAPPTAAAAAAPAAPSYTGPDPCKLARGDSPVARACNQGGIRAAKTAMKDLVKAAKSKGLRLECDECHKSDEDFSQLTDSAKDKFKQLLAAAKGA